MSAIERAYQEGIDAKTEGKEENDCPYPQGFDERRSWFNGFNGLTVEGFETEVEEPVAPKPEELSDAERAELKKLMAEEIDQLRSVGKNDEADQLQKASDEVQG